MADSIAHLLLWNCTREPHDICANATSAWGSQKRMLAHSADGRGGGGDGNILSGHGGSIVAQDRSLPFKPRVGRAALVHGVLHRIHPADPPSLASLMEAHHQALIAREEMGDAMDFFEWSALADMHQELKERLAEAESISHASSDSHASR